MSSIPSQISIAKVFPMETRKAKQDKNTEGDEDSRTEVLSMSSSGDLSSANNPTQYFYQLPAVVLMIMKDIMLDPVTGDCSGGEHVRTSGNIALLLVLYDQALPLTGNLVKVEELSADTVVKKAIA
jgi:hypothetical protein